MAEETKQLKEAVDNAKEILRQKTALPKALIRESIDPPKDNFIEVLRLKLQVKLSNARPTVVYEPAPSNDITAASSQSPNKFLLKTLLRLRMPNTNIMGGVSKPESVRGLSGQWGQKFSFKPWVKRRNFGPELSSTPLEIKPPSMKRVSGRKPPKVKSLNGKTGAALATRPPTGKAENIKIVDARLCEADRKYSSDTHPQYLMSSAAAAATLTDTSTSTADVSTASVTSSSRKPIRRTVKKASQTESGTTRKGTTHNPWSTPLGNSFSSPTSFYLHQPASGDHLLSPPEPLIHKTKRWFPSSPSSPVNKTNSNLSGILLTSSVAVDTKVAAEQAPPSPQQQVHERLLDLQNPTTPKQQRQRKDRELQGKSAFQIRAERKQWMERDQQQHESQAQGIEHEQRESIDLEELRERALQVQLEFTDQSEQKISDDHLNFQAAMRSEKISGTPRAHKQSRSEHTHRQVQTEPRNRKTVTSEEMRDNFASVQRALFLSPQVQSKRERRIQNQSATASPETPFAVRMVKTLARDNGSLLEKIRDLKRLMKDREEMSVLELQKRNEEFDALVDRFTDVKVEKDSLTRRLMDVRSNLLGENLKRIKLLDRIADLVKERDHLRHDGVDVQQLRAFRLAIDSVSAELNPSKMSVPSIEERGGAADTAIQNMDSNFMKLDGNPKS